MTLRDWRRQRSAGGSVARLWAGIVPIIAAPAKAAAGTDVLQTRQMPAGSLSALLSMTTLDLVNLAMFGNPLAAASFTAAPSLQSPCWPLEDGARHSPCTMSLTSHPRRASSLLRAVPDAATRRQSLRCAHACHEWHGESGQHVEARRVGRPGCRAKQPKRPRRRDGGNEVAHRGIWC